MTRYISQITVASDNTTKAAWSCTRTITSAPGTCVLQITGGSGGIDTVTGSAGICCEWTVPAGVSSVVIELWGGGGGGAAPGAMCTCTGRGQGGGGGAYSRKTLAVAAGTKYTVCVGGGGPGGISTGASSCCCGQTGGVTYVTGTGLTNFCANGGYGGESRCMVDTSAIQTPNGGWAGPGGDLNVRGGDGYAWGSNGACCGWTVGGQSPFGGRTIYQGFHHCGNYSDNIGTGKAGGPCGFTGNFPGGGGSGAFPSCCCGICTCGGCGAPGLVRIWM